MVWKCSMSILHSKMQSKNRHSHEHKEAGREGARWAALHHGCPAPGAAAASALFGSLAHSSQPQEALYTVNEGHPEPRDALGVVGRVLPGGGGWQQRAGAASVCWARPWAWSACCPLHGSITSRSRRACLQCTPITFSLPCSLSWAGWSPNSARLGGSSRKAGGGSP